MEDIPQKVIVIGAGLAGLACAWELRSHGVQVLVLEGKHDVGGRVYTDTDGIDKGGHWIHGAAASTDSGGGDGDGDTNSNASGLVRNSAGQLMPLTNPIRYLCDAHGIVTIETGGDSTYIGGKRPIGGDSKDGIALYGPDGARLSSTAEARFWEVYDQFTDAEEDALAALSKRKDDVLVQTVHEQIREKLSLSNADKLFLQWHIDSEYGGDYGSCPTEMRSATYHNRVDSFSYVDYGGVDRILVGGFKQLTSKLVAGINAGCNNRIKTARAGQVMKVEHSHGSQLDMPAVMVHTADGMVHEANAAVVTVPLGVLKRTPNQTGCISFCPPLPKWKTDAFARGHMGCLYKLMLEWESPHWPKDQYTFGYINHFEPSMIVNLVPTHSKAILVFLIGGPTGRSFERRPVEDNMLVALEACRKLFGANVPVPIAWSQTEWSHDPFAFGAYSSMGPRGANGDRELLGKRVNKLFWAGEHTSSHQFGSAHGALLTGLDQAMAITGAEQCNLLSNPLLVFPSSSTSLTPLTPPTSSSKHKSKL